MTKIILAALVALPIALGGASVAVAVAEEPNTAVTEAPKAAVANDVIAKVGDQAVTFNQINTMLNSTAVVGVSVPALGTPERDTARIVVLDKVISANLLYLDAKRQGLDKDPAYQRQLQNFSNGMLAGQYHRRFMAGEITVSEEEVQAFFTETMVPDTEMTDDLHTQIEATLRKRKLHERLAAQRGELRKGLEVDVYTGNLDPAGDDARADDVVMAKIGEEVISWGDVKTTLIAAGKGAIAMDPLAMESDARLPTLQTEIDKRIMAQKAREAGLDKDPLYRSRFNEFQKTRLVNMHRANLAREREPSDEQLQAYYEANRMDIMQVEMRKTQDVVVKTREEADPLKAKIESGELTMFQAAADYSIAPGAKQQLGEVGWVAEGRAQPALNEAIFNLGPGELGGPVESTEGWHLLKVLDVSDAKFDNFDDKETQKLARRRYIHDQLDVYVMDLRKNNFTVEVYEDNLVRLAQKEADMVARLTEQAAQPGSRTEQRVEELQKLIGE
jgi:parvulin-like peptidyl-prolyl isomerase